MLQFKINTPFQFATRALMGKTMLLLFVLAPALYSQNLILTDMTVSRTKTFSAKDTIMVGPDFTVENTGDVTLKAGNAIVFNPGTVVLNGGILNALIGFIKIDPQDTTIQVQQVVQYNVQKGIGSNYLPHSEVNWFVKKDRVGPITDDGQLYAYFPGKVNIMAKGETFSIKTGLTVVDTAQDQSGVNIINILRNFPNEKVKKAKIIKEGEEYVLSGLKHPGNILNGTRIYFPKGSLHQDITVEIEIPKFCKIKEDSILFANKIINGIRFNVYVNDTQMDPYYFDKPVSFAMPFKRGILKHYGIKISNLGLFFATDTLSFDSLGVGRVVVDSTVNLVYGLVEHFSNIVIREKEVSTSIESPEKNDNTVKRFSLKQNFPNPFNPSTIIEFTLPEAKFTTLKVYNLLGKELATLVSKKLNGGNHTFTFDGRKMASGVYYYHLIAGEYQEVKKMLLLK